MNSELLPDFQILHAVSFENAVAIRIQETANRSILTWGEEEEIDSEEQSSRKFNLCTGANHQCFDFWAFFQGPGGKAVDLKGINRDIL